MYWQREKKPSVITILPPQTLRPKKTQRNLVKLCLEDGAADLLVRVADEALDDGVDLRHRLA
jgi:hypothetical protein